jgi:endo-cleaving rubber dioxygenase
MNTRFQPALIAFATLLLGACADGTPTEAAPVDPGSGGGPGTTEYPLLGGKRGGNVWANFCEGQPDSAALPRDPRTLLVPGVNEGRAVAMNAYWRDCGNVVPRPTTCGELREQAKLGALVAHGNGEIGSPLSFAGGQENPSGIAAEDYNRLWEVWGLPGRPDNFDELVAQRHGSPLTPWRNPYPLPGEDPNLTDGGSGQLPLAYTQIRNADGTWTGQIGTKVCVACHNGQIDTASGELGPMLGGAGSIGDFAVSGSDFSEAGGAGVSAALRLITISENRGTGAIDFFQLAFVLFSSLNPELLLNPKIVFSQAIGNIKSPPWWNLAYRSQKFHGAILPTDSSRIDLAAYYDLSASLSGRDDEALAWNDAHSGPFQVWAESQESPQYPGPINTQLAEAGAILFHSKDLWADGLNNPAPRPDAGNGSCASCHGAYSPRYVHDPAFLETPELAGIAAYTVPMDVIRTDPVYADAMQSLRNADGSFPSATDKQNFLYCGHGNYGETEDLTPILLAPPLWGVWAAAPYLHNGSVPNIWGVLDPASERPKLWRRVSTPARPDQEGLVVMGYDTSFERAYDQDKLGWKYDVLACGDEGSAPWLACTPGDESGPSTLQNAISLLFENVGALWNLPRPEGLRMNQQDIENRKVYNTYKYSQGNQGHDFTAVLNDNERRAIIEYLKTL